MNTTLRGHTCRYEVEGTTGPRVLLIMGFGMSGEAWSPIVERLRADHQVCWYDARGLGDSTPGDGPHGLRSLADDAAALLDALGWEDAEVAGISMGGMIAQHLAVRHPHRVRSLTLIATHMGPGVAWLPRMAALRLFIRANTSPAAERMTVLKALLFADPDNPPPGLDEARLRELARPARADVRAAHLLSILRDRRRASLASLSDLPVLIVQPQADILVPPRASTALHRALPSSRLLSLPRAGHGALLEAPEAITRAMRQLWSPTPA